TLSLSLFSNKLKNLTFRASGDVCGGYGIALWGTLFCMPFLLYAQGNLKALPEGEYILSGISVEGIEFTDKNSVIALSGLRIGQTIKVPGEDFSNAIKKLWRQNIFSDVEISVEKIVGDRLYILLHLTERPRISKYTFVGVTKSQADDLREKIKFIRGQRLTEAKKRSAIRTIKNFFEEKGYLNTKVEIKTQPDESVPNGVTIIITVNKGPRVKIQQIFIDGNIQIKASKLKRQLKETKEKRFYRFWKRSKYISANFKKDLENLIEYYNNKGYRDAQLLADTFYKVDEKNINVKIKLHEGKKYYIRNITWSGNTKYTSGYLDTVLSIKRGSPYNKSLLERRLHGDPSGFDVSTLYLDDGYLFFRADPIENVDSDSIDLHIRIYEGPQARYDKIIIEGNTKTSDHVILREIRTLPGNKFSRSEVIRTQRELLNLGFFSQENFQIIPIPNPERGTVDIKYIVEEKPSDQLFLQGGWGGRIRDANNNIVGGGLIATVGIQFNNFSTRKIFNAKAWRPLPSGDGQKLSLRIQTNGVAFQNYAISFLEPWFGGRRPNSFGVGVNYSLQRSIFTGNRIDMVNVHIDWGQRMKFPDDFFRSFTTLRYSYLAATNARNIFPELTTDAYANIISIRQAFDRTSIDVPIFPTRGSSLNFSVEATPPWSSFIQEDYAAGSKDRYRLLEFHKWKFRAETYSKITRNKLPMVLYTRVMYGFLGSYTDRKGLSPFERFYLGGDGLSGFVLDGREIIAFRGYRLPTVGMPDGEGAAIFSKITFELRQPLSLAPTATVWLHVFGEAGNAWPNFRNFNPFNLARSVGLGIRIFLPMFGLLGVDYGYGFDDGGSSLRNINGGNWHFMIGQQF
ncbi:MAG: outer membrane protein assembly factor BamA, partial [Bacteroidia bacterium]|nr:outer membrane protein assembly factor BamA [Bacteroidia bacterium]